MNVFYSMFYFAKKDMFHENAGQVFIDFILVLAKN